MTMIAITVLNQKGGVGKTTLCHHAAGALVTQGLRVLLVDYDPQASLTQGLLGSEDAEKIGAADSTAAIAAGEEPEPARVIHQVTDLPGIALAPGSPALAEWNLANPAGCDLYTQARLADFLHGPGVTGFDVALIDCPPNLQLLSWSALVASDYLLIPVQAEDYGVQGLRPVLDFLGQVRSHKKPDLRLAGIVINLFDPRRTVHKFYEEMLRKTHGGAVMTTVLKAYSAYPEAVLHRLPVTTNDPRSKAALAIRELASELTRRVGLGTSQGHFHAEPEPEEVSRGKA